MMKPQPLTFSSRTSANGSLTLNSQANGSINTLTPHSNGSLRSPIASYRVTPGGKPRAWADYTPTPNGSGQFFFPSSMRSLRGNSMDAPSMLWPPTPSPMAASAYPPSAFPSGSQVQTDRLFANPQPMAASQAPPVMMVHQSAPAPTIVQQQAQPGHIQLQQQQQAPVQAQPLHYQVPAGYPVVAMPSQVTQPAVPMMQVASGPVIHATLVQEAGAPSLETAVLGQSLPSIGSALHATGRCSPCAWYWDPRKCQNGVNCQYCHICPEGELKRRKKAKVAAMKLGVLEPAQQQGTMARPANLKLDKLI